MDPFFGTLQHKHVRKNQNNSKSSVVDMNTKIVVKVLETPNGLESCRESSPMEFAVQCFGMFGLRVHELAVQELKAFCSIFEGCRWDAKSDVCVWVCVCFFSPRLWQMQQSALCWAADFVPLAGNRE